jgi:phosphoribosylanthranilate isomerase
VSVKVKICGVWTPAIVEAAAKAGADFIGLVFCAKSPRNVSLADAQGLAEAASGKIATVAVLVDPDDQLINAIAETVRPDILQLHGSETPERVAAVRALAERPVMKAISVADAGDITAARAYGGIADYILFDAKAAPGAALPGGNGVPFDWRALKGARQPFALSGGLNAANVGEAIRLTGATLVDVSSGVEIAPGVKDARLVKSFTAAARATAQRRTKAS